MIVSTHLSLAPALAVAALIGLLASGPARAQVGTSGPSDEDRFRQLSPQQQDEYRQRFRELMKLRPEERADLRARLDRLMSMSPTERGDVERNYKRFRELQPAQRQAVLDEWGKFRALPEAKRAKLRGALKRVLAMPPQQRDRVLENMRRWKEMSLADREKARQQLLDKRGGPAAKGHPANVAKPDDDNNNKPSKPSRESVHERIQERKGNRMQQKH